MNVRSVVLGSAAALSVLPLKAADSAELIVGQGETATNFIDAACSQLQDARLVTADGGRVEKTGDGKWTVPANVRQAFHPLALDVKHSTVALAEAAGAAPANPVPAFVAETAAMWLDASVDASLGKRVEGDVCFVDNWYDVRETTQATPTRFYAKANFGGTINGNWT